MNYVVEAWAPEYGTPADGELGDSTATVDVGVERATARWEPIAPRGRPDSTSTILFTDGVRRIDARVWIESPEGGARLGVCASYCAGAVLCTGRSRIVAAEVQRGLFTPAAGAEAIVCKHATYPLRASAGDTIEQLWLALQQRMAELEVALASAHPADLVVIDGPLSGRQNVPGAVGFVKTHHVSYLPPALERVVGRLEPGERTPLFLTTSSWSRFSWYLRLPGPVEHQWSGIVRCEACADADVTSVCELADSVASQLPRFASAGHKDPRAPQNLYPIGGLERELRRRLGDSLLLYRSLRSAAA